MFGTRNRIRLDIKLSHTKIEKHHHYLVKHKTPDMRPTAPVLFYPNIFYFAVPTELVEIARALVKGLPYGVFNLDTLSVAAKAKTLRTDVHEVGTYKNLFSRACTLRADLDRDMYAQRFEVLNLVAKEYGLEPGSVGHMRLMKLGAPSQG